MSNAELLIEEIKTLPESRMAEVLDFVEFLKQKEAQRARIDREVEEAGTCGFSHEEALVIANPTVKTLEKIAGIYGRELNISL